MGVEGGVVVLPLPLLSLIIMDIDTFSSTKKYSLSYQLHVSPMEDV